MLAAFDSFASFPRPSPDQIGAPSTSCQPCNNAQWIGYDIGVSDPTRIGRLPAGTPYFQRGQPAKRMQGRKLSAYRYNLNTFGPLTTEVKFVPLVFEISGAFGPAAADEFSELCKEAASLVKRSGGGNYRSRGEPHTWNALRFANLYSQMISFSIVKCTALSIVRAVNKAARISQGEAGAEAET